MTDRELLELAAKAAGIQLRFLLNGTLPFSDGPRVGEWNPLTDDGDALRLAVKLGIFASPRFFHFRELARLGRQKDEDDFAASRRAIVRAAADIGRAMP